VLPPEVRFIPFGRLEPLVAAMSCDHPLAGRKCVQLRELAATSRFIDFQPRTALQSKIRAMAEAVGAERRVMCELGTITEMVRMAATGAAVAIVPRAFTEDIKGQPGPPDGIRALRLAEPDGYLTLGFFCNRDRAASAAMRAFLDLFSAERHVVSPPGAARVGTVLPAVSSTLSRGHADRPAPGEGPRSLGLLGGHPKAHATAFDATVDAGNAKYRSLA
jgi:DNA-binding transcriptional LysR family regulator